MTSIIEDKISVAFPDINEEELAEISMILSMRRSFDMSAYKDNYLRRRVAIRIRSTHCSTPGEYCNLLRQDSQELDQLQKTLTIHVSQFFRNPTMFEKLRSDLLPGIFAALKPEPLQIWCLGCAAGEEPYSLAILLREYFSQEIRQLSLTIIGTDIDQGVLQAAHAAHYSAERVKDVPEKLLDRYFHQEDSQFCLIEEIREMVTFIQADITNFDHYLPSNLVMCRNTLIYFNRADQEKILIGIAGTLVPGGLLVLGKSETLVGEARRRFESICPVERIYRRL
ncbi:MAG TPA: protein-glutamate O-methyltransferase CheR [Desulfuromonadaceae bacterium]